MSPASYQGPSRRGLLREQLRAPIPADPTNCSEALSRSFHAISFTMFYDEMFIFIIKTHIKF